MKKEKVFKNYNFEEVDDILDKLRFEKQSIQSELHSYYCAAHPKQMPKEVRDKLLNRRSEIRNEIMYITNCFKNDRCGYWDVCAGHGYECPCSSTAEVSLGFNNEVYENLKNHMLD